MVLGSVRRRWGSGDRAAGLQRSYIPTWSDFLPCLEIHCEVLTIRVGTRYREDVCGTGVCVLTISFDRKL